MLIKCTFKFCCIDRQQEYSNPYSGKYIHYKYIYLLKCNLGASFALAYVSECVEARPTESLSPVKADLGLCVSQTALFVLFKSTQRAKPFHQIV